MRHPVQAPAALICVAMTLLLAACGGGARPAVTRSPFPSSTDASSPPTARSSAIPTASPVFLPGPDDPLPTGPAATASTLARTIDALHASIRPWREHDYRGDPSQAIVLQALYEQRLYRALAKDPELWRGTRRHLSGPLRDEAQGNVTAVADLRAIVSPVGHPVAFRVGAPTPADDLRRYDDQADRRFGVPWNVLAAVNFVESKFDRARNPSSAGAQGPMQFLPSTWAAYGMGGDIHDPRDAIMGAANYLRANGAPHDLRRALFAYNRSRAYVEAILAYAERMRVDRDAFAEYYDWQVFVATPAGDRRLTGPGL